jgi:ABC-2 type transport system permease protein
MNRLLSDTVSFAKQYLRTKIGPFFSFMFPVLLIVLFGAVFSAQDGGGMSLPIQNLDTGPSSAMLMEMLNQTGYFEISMIDSQSDIRDYVNDNSLALALSIPANFSSNLASSTPTAVVLCGDTARSSFPIAQGVLDAVINQMNYNISGASPVVLFEVQFAGAEQFGAYDFLLPGFVGLTVMISAMYFMTSVCAEHRSRGYFKLLTTTTLRKSEWLSAKFLFNSTMLLGSLMLTFAVAMLVFDLKAVLTPLSVVLVIVGTFMFTSLGMLLGVLVKDPESAAAVSNAIGFPMMFLSGSFWDLSSSPLYLQAIAKAMPLTYLNEGLRDTMVYGNETSALANLAMVAVLGVVFFILASKLMSWKER